MRPLLPTPPAVARLFLLHCAECWLYVQEEGSQFPPSFLLLSGTVKTGMHVDLLGGGGWKCTLLFASNQEGTMRELGPWTHTPKCAELYFKQEEDPDGEAAAPHVGFTDTCNNISARLIEQLIPADHGSPGNGINHWDRNYNICHVSQLHFTESIDYP